MAKIFKQEFARIEMLINEIKAKQEEQDTRFARIEGYLNG